MSDETKLKLFMQKHIAARAETFRLARKTRGLREKPRALIVEDQAFSRQLLFSFLIQDFQVDTAEDARHGLQLFMDYAPDIIFLDIELPDETGHTMAHLVKSIDPSTFIVMVTASNAYADVSEAVNNQVDGFIVKPYNKGKILTAIAAFRASQKQNDTKGPKA